MFYLLVFYEFMVLYLSCSCWNKIQGNVTTLLSILSWQLQALFTIATNEACTLFSFRYSSFNFNPIKNVKQSSDAAQNSFFALLKNKKIFIRKELFE